MATRRDPLQRPYIPLRAKVTRVGKSGDADKIVKTAEEVVAFFDAHGWPDNWASWRNALADPIWQLACRADRESAHRLTAQYHAVITYFR